MNLETKAKLDPLARTLGLFTAYELDEREFKDEWPNRLHPAQGTELPDTPDNQQWHKNKERKPRGGKHD